MSIISQKMNDITNPPYKMVHFSPEVVDPPPMPQCVKCRYRKFKAFKKLVLVCADCKKRFCESCLVQKLCSDCYQNQPVFMHNTKLIFTGNMVFWDD